MTSANTGSAIGSDSIAPPIVTSDGSSHSDARIHPSSASAAGMTLRQPRRKVASTSHHGSGCARSKRRTKKSHAIDRTKGIPVPASMSGQSVGMRVAEVRLSEGRVGVERSAASRIVRRAVRTRRDRDRRRERSHRESAPVRRDGDPRAGPSDRGRERAERSPARRRRRRSRSSRERRTSLHGASGRLRPRHRPHRSDRPPRRRLARRGTRARRSGSRPSALVRQRLPFVPAAPEAAPGASS